MLMARLVPVYFLSLAVGVVAMALSAVVAKGLDRGTFTLTSKAPEGMRVTGSWRCD